MGTHLFGPPCTLIQVTCIRI